MLSFQFQVQPPIEFCYSEYINPQEVPVHELIHSELSLYRTQFVFEW